MDGKALELAKMLMDAVTTIIGIVGLLYGGWSLFEGLTNDQPESKKRGFTVWIATAVVCAMILTAQRILL